MNEFPLLEVKDLQIHFRIGTDIKKAIDGISLSLDEGETVGVVGTSGSGKTVLAHSIMGLLSEPGYIAGGSIRYRGKELVNMPEPEIHELRGHEIALIVPNPRVHQNPLLSVGAQLENVILAKQSLTKHQAQEQAIGLLKSVAIGDPERVSKMYPNELSGGMSQRVIIAMALANSPRLILADEPTQSLDVTIQRQVLDLMTNLVSETGTSLLIMTRDLGIIARYCQRVIVLKDGKVIEDSSVPSFFANPKHSHSRYLLQAAFAARGED